MEATLADLVTKETLEALAGERAFERGTDYFADGTVVGLREVKDTITARVRGTYYYRVKLSAAAEGLAFECQCPVGQDRVFCKHCVAVGLAWLEKQRHPSSASGRKSKREVTNEEIRTHLMAQDKSAMVELVLEQADWDSGFRDRLVLMTAQKGARTPDVAAFRAAIDKAIRRRNFVEYQRMAEYATGIEAVMDSLEDLLKHGHAVETRELTERALKEMESALNHVDDSDGFMSGILERLQELHLDACRATKPDRVGLAKFLFDWEVGSDWDIFHGAAETYADVLGKEGLAAYRKLAEGQWAKVPPLAPGEEEPNKFQRRYRVTAIMQDLARQTGNVEELVAVLSRDLSDPYAFLKIAEEYQLAGNNNAALEWAERGVRAFPVRTDGRLREFLIEEYHRRGRHGDAIAIAWTSFQERLGLFEYQRLHKSARRAKQWPEWREKALTLLREDIAARKKQSLKEDHWAPARPDRSVLVEIYLWEGDVQAAWIEAKEGGCHDALWFRLAEARESDHPEDAIIVYTEQLKSTLRHADKQAYHEAVEILRKIRKLMPRVGKEAEFGPLIQSLRAQYKQRRNLLKLLDAKGWKSS